MISFLRGIIADKSAPWVVVDVQGVGYEMRVPMSTLFALPDVGQTITLLTQLIIREDGHHLFGFMHKAEKQSFQQLIKISGVGPAIALAILSGLSVEELQTAVAQQDSGRLIKIPGIGKKTAERLLLELRDKFAITSSTIGASATPHDARRDIAEALQALGYSDKEAQQASRNVPESVDINEGIKLALKHLMRL